VILFGNTFKHEAISTWRLSATTIMQGRSVNDNLMVVATDTCTEPMFDFISNCFADIEVAFWRLATAGRRLHDSSSASTTTTTTSFLRIRNSQKSKCARKQQNVC